MEPQGFEDKVAYAVIGAYDLDDKITRMDRVGGSLRGARRRRRPRPMTGS
jgi:hypothetical protein